MTTNVVSAEAASAVKKWTCSRCGSKFRRVNEFSLFGYKQCLACDMKMLEAVGKGESWPEKDKAV